jgi:glutamine synthetase
VAAFFRTAERSERRCSRRRYRIRWVIDPGFPGDSGKRHACRPGSDDCFPRSVFPGDDTGPVCNIRDPVTGQSYSRDARYIAQKAETYLKGTGQADKSYFGPEAEFFVFNDVRYGQDINFAFHEIDSSEGSWNTGKDEEPNLGHKPRPKEGYFPVPPTDSMQALRTEMVLTMESLGIAIEAHHHEVATGGQNEIDMRFTTLTRMADNLSVQIRR